MEGLGSRRKLFACAMAVLVALGVLGVNSSAAFARHGHPPPPSPRPPHTPTVTPYGPSGLDNPRGLAFAPDGRLYVAESGHGGSECFPPEHPGEEAFCVGFTSGISSIDAHRAHTVLSGFVSLAPSGGNVAEGIEGLAFDNDGGLFAVVGNNETLATQIGPNPYVSAQTLTRGAAQLGRLIHLRHERRWHSSEQFETVANVGLFDVHWGEEPEHRKLNPEQPPDGDPYAVYAAPYERFVVDAASNTVDEVSQNGTVNVIAYIPNPPISDAAPTCIDRGPDGAFYVGEEPGFGNGPGTSVVWRVVKGQAPEEWASGLTGVVGCGFGPGGKFYATEFSTLGVEKLFEENGLAAVEGTGAVVEVPPHSTHPIPIVSNTPGQKDSPLTTPNGFASRDGAIYVSNWSVSAASTGRGQVVRITTP
jgi:hypothetical protein